MRLFPARTPTDPDGVPMILAAELHQRLRRGERILPLDVRQPAAYAEHAGAIPGSRRIPPAEVPDRYAEVPRDLLVVPYCT
jgi:rhodanese-related sulfurtransferase